MRSHDLISRLQKVRETGKMQWTACCPAHEDRSPSLAIKELDDGRVLIKCFADCQPGDILAAVGLSFEALFPERLPEDRYKPIRRPFPAADVLELLRSEALTIQVIAADMRRGHIVSDIVKQRLGIAYDRIARAIDG
jgi:hypothetical protein